MVTVTNVGATYDAVSASKGLGVQDIDFTGVTALVFRVRVNKIGTGTQSWRGSETTDPRYFVDSTYKGARLRSCLTVNK